MTFERTIPVTFVVLRFGVECHKENEARFDELFESSSSQEMTGKPSEFFFEGRSFGATKACNKVIVSLLLVSLFRMMRFE